MGSNPIARSSRPSHIHSPLRGPTVKSAGLLRFWRDTLWCSGVERTAVLLSGERILSGPWGLGDLHPRFQRIEIALILLGGAAPEFVKRSLGRTGPGAEFLCDNAKSCTLHGRIGAIARLNQTATGLPRVCAFMKRECATGESEDGRTEAGEGCGPDGGIAG